MNVHRVAIGSDIHFDQEHRPLWENFCKFLADYKPEVVVLSGDIVDLGMISKYTQGGKDPVNAIEQIKVAVQEVNRLVKLSGRVVLMEGNHDERWDKAILGEKAQALYGAKGLTLQDQFLQQGMHASVSWVHETVHCPGYMLGRRAAIVQHGHVKPIGGKTPALAMLAAIPGISVIRGHLHRAQMACRTSLGRNMFGLAMPHMSTHHEYAGGNPDWQVGFCTLEFYGRSRLRDCTRFTPNIIIADDKGRFSVGGRLYG